MMKRPTHFVCRVAALALLQISSLLAQTPAATPRAVEITAEPDHHPVLENDFVRVTQVEVAAHSATLLHRHRHDYIFVTLGNAHVSNEVEGKEPVDVQLVDGDIRLVGGNFDHITRNLSEQPFRNVTIEIMQDEKLRQTPSHWPEQNNETSFPGVSIKVLFVKDGARVSEVTIEPGATIPSHHHDGPHLLVAVSDLDIRSDVDGKGPTSGKFSAGAVKWVPGVYTHPLTNTGASPARFVTVEF